MKVVFTFQAAWMFVDRKKRGRRNTQIHTEKGATEEEKKEEEIIRNDKTEREFRLKAGIFVQ